MKRLLKSILLITVAVAASHTYATDNFGGMLNVVSVSMSEVPAPAAALLFGPILASVVALRRKSKS